MRRGGEVSDGEAARPFFLSGEALRGEAGRFPDGEAGKPFFRDREAL